MFPLGSSGLEHVLDGVEAGDGQRPDGGSVVRQIPGDHLVAGGLADGDVVLPGQLPGRLDGFAATRGEEDSVQVAGGECRQAGRELHRRGVGVGPDGEVGELLGLFGHDLGELVAAVAGLHREETGEAIEVALAVGVPDVAAIATVDDGDVAVRPPGSAWRSAPTGGRRAMVCRSAGVGVAFTGTPGEGRLGNQSWRSAPDAQGNQL